ncbi:MAG: type IV toxin-antitoxin system AbiEi family antitoxin domain-containing protein [Bacteroidota bacterium]
MRQMLVERFKQNGGFLRTADSLTAAEKYHLRQLIRKGVVSRVKRGFYRLNDSPLIFQEAEIARMIPDGIFCMFTAWSFYGLATYVSAEYHVAIPKTLKIVLPDYPPVKLYYWVAETFEIGKVSAEMNNSQVNVYDIERSVCDAVKFRNKIGADLMSEILRNYVRRHDKNLDKMLKYAAELRISKTLNQLLQVII